MKRTVAGVMAGFVLVAAGMPVGAEPSHTSGSRMAGLNRPETDPPYRHSISARRVTERPPDSRGRIQAIAGDAELPVVLVDFSDNPAESLLHPPEEFEAMLFEKDHPNGAGSMRDYYLHQSGGLFDITGDVSPWVRAPRTYAQYSGSDNGLQKSTPNAQTLVTDAASKADQYLDYCDYDTDEDGVVDALMVVHAGVGAETSTGDTGIWSHKSTTSYTTKDVCSNGEKAVIGPYTIQPESNPGGVSVAPGAPANLISIGVFVHEFGHVLGLPDLYDTDDNSPSNGGVGSWGVMAAGNYGFDLQTPWRPVPFSAWSKIALGWAIPEEIAADLDTIAVAISDGTQEGVSTSIVKVSPGGSPYKKEYFLLERRGPVEPYSKGMPEGLAVWHVDESRLADLTAVNADDDHRLVHMLQADGLDELGGIGTIKRGDAGDLFPGPALKTFLDASGTPTTVLYSGALSHVALRNIQLAKGFLTLDVSLSDGLTSAPAAPASLAAATDGTGVTLEWDPPPDTDVFEYRIYRSESGGSFDLIAATSEQVTSVNDRSAIDGSAYRYRVTAFNGLESAPSNTVAVTGIAPGWVAHELDAKAGSVTGNVGALSAVGGGTVTIKATKANGGKKVDYYLDFRADVAFDELTDMWLEVVPKNALRFKLGVRNMVQGGYDVIGGWHKGRKNKTTSVSIPLDSELMRAEDGLMQIGLLDFKLLGFKHILDMVRIAYERNPCSGPIVARALC